jgi:hypothetical protein
MHYVDKVHQSSSTGLILESESDLWAYVGAHASARDRGCLLRNEGFDCGDLTATVCRLPERAQKSRLRKGDLLWIPYTILEHPVDRSAQRGVPPVDGIRRYQGQARE